VGFIGWIVVGLIAGSLAQRVTGVERRGCLYTLLLGVLGAVVGGALFNAAGGRGIGDFGLWSLFVAFVGAGALCLVFDVLFDGGRRRRGRRGRR
jgi:uncharacterized membrane protein YeaQ/YmgE (transglycosylase-associated protein family)